MLVLARSLEQAEELDGLLWEFDEDAFIPHQIAGDEDDAITPVLIIAAWRGRRRSPAGAQPARRLRPGLFERVLEVVPPMKPSAALARAGRPTSTPASSCTSSTCDPDIGHRA